MINYAARKSNSRKDKKLPPTHDVAAGVGLAEHHELIGGEKMAFGKNVSFAIYQERGRRTFAALHPGCVDRYGAPKVVYWDFVKGGEAVWF